MNNRHRLLWFFALLIILIFNGLILQKEHLLAKGQTIFLALAPVDPRSLIQGDYMQLRYAIAQNREAFAERNGFIVIELDENNVGHYARVHDPDIGLAENELLLPYRKRAFDIRIGPESFLFQEGHGQYYRNARYAELRVSESGDLLLVGLRGSELEELGPP